MTAVFLPEPELRGWKARGFTRSLLLAKRDQFGEGDNGGARLHVPLAADEVTSFEHPRNHCRCHCRVAEAPPGQSASLPSTIH